MENRRRWLVVILTALLVPLLMSFVVPPSFSLTLQIPAAMAIKRLGLSIGERADAVIVVSVLTAWLSIALPVAIATLMLTSKNRAIKLAGVSVLIGVTVWLLIAGRSQKERVYVGIYEHGFERSDFHPNGNCWRPPYWLEGVAPVLRGTANYAAVRVTFVGDATSLGGHGHLGTYVREVKVNKVLSVEPAQPCR